MVADDSAVLRCFFSEMSVRCQKSGRLKKERKKSENVDDRPTQPQAIEKKPPQNVEETKEGESKM